MKKILFSIVALLAAAVAGCGGGKIDSESVVDVPAAAYDKIENHNNVAQNFLIAAPPQQKNIATEVFKNTWQSVVMIKKGMSQGSGVVVLSNFVATNCHVIEDDMGLLARLGRLFEPRSNDKIAVYKAEDQRTNEDVPFYAKVVHRNDAYDFCILEVERLWAIPVRIRRYETLHVGESAYALGAPHGFDMSLSEGLISQLRKNEKGLPVIQTDAATSPGSSGGGLFDVNGSLIGILTRKLVGKKTEGIVFAIPADLCLEFKLKV